MFQQLSPPPLSESTWAEIEVRKGSLVSVYRCRLANTDLARFFLEGRRDFVFVAHDVYWSYSDLEGEAWTVLGKTPGVYENATGVGAWPAELVVAILLFDDTAAEVRAQHARVDGRMQ